MARVATPWSSGSASLLCWPVPSTDEQVEVLAAAGLYRLLRASQRCCPAIARLLSMTPYRIGEVAELMGVSPDTVRRLVDSGQIRTARTSRGDRLVDGADLARFLAEQGAASGFLPTAHESARNHFPGIVTRVVKDGVMAQVDIQSGPHRVVSLMSREAADELKLEPGVRAIAVVKSTNVVVELPR
jgi:molybdopterin-binding protein